MTKVRCLHKWGQLGSHIPQGYEVVVPTWIQEEINFDTLDVTPLDPKVHKGTVAEYLANLRRTADSWGRFEEWLDGEWTLRADIAVD